MEKLGDIGESKGGTDNDGCEPTGTSEKLGDLGGSKGGTDNDGCEPTGTSEKLGDIGESNRQRHPDVPKRCRDSNAR